MTVKNAANLISRGRNIGGLYPPSQLLLPRTSHTFYVARSVFQHVARTALPATVRACKFDVCLRTFFTCDRINRVYFEDTRGLETGLLGRPNGAREGQEPSVVVCACTSPPASLRLTCLRAAAVGLANRVSCEY